MCKWIGLFGLICLLLIAPVWAQDDECSPDDMIPVGVVFPEGNLLSVTIGEPLFGVQAMIEALDGCIDWHIVAANDRDDAEEAVQQLIDSYDVPIVVGSGSQAVRDGLTSAAETHNIVFWEVTEALTDADSWIFSPRPTHAQLGAAAATYIEEVVEPQLELDDLRVALVYESRPAGQAIASGFLDALSIEPIYQPRLPRLSGWHAQFGGANPRAGHQCSGGWGI